MFRKALLAGVMIAGMATAANATISGSTSGPDDSFSINMFFDNLGPEDVLGLTIDASGTTSIAGPPLIFESFSPGGTAGPATFNGTLNTSVLSFSWGAGGFTSGQSFSLSLDPDIFGDSSYGAVISELLGTTVTATLAGGGIFHGVFVDDPAERAGLKLSAVPLPGALSLMLLGLGMLGAVGSRMRRAA